ncbi:MAG: RNA polymerase sigma factor [Thermonemataceae bacterium]
MTNAEIIKGCRHHRPEAQKALYDTYAHRLMGICVRYARDREEAKDIFQEAFMKIFKHIHQIRKIQSLEGWLKRVTINVAITYCNKHKVWQQFISDEHLDDQGEVKDYLRVVNSLTSEDLLMLLEQLPYNYRTVFNLYVIEEYTHKEIAQALSISVSNSKMLLMRAKQKLMQLFNQIIENDRYEQKTGS